MFCIDFEDDDLVANNMGVYRPWILNDNVLVVTEGGSKCGFFNESRLEVPFFSNAYSSFTSLRITFRYKIAPGGSADQGLFSNDCFGGAVNAAGNSLYCSASGGQVTWGLRDPNVQLGGVSGSSQTC